jgi:hypothetical protein
MLSALVSSYCLATFYMSLKFLTTVFVPEAPGSQSSVHSGLSCISWIGSRIRYNGLLSRQDPAYGINKQADIPKR